MKSDKSVMNFWIIFGVILITVGIILGFSVFTGGGSGSTNGMAVAVFGSMMAQLASWPVYLVIAGLISCGVGYLSAIHTRLCELQVSDRPTRYSQPDRHNDLRPEDIH